MELKNLKIGTQLRVGFAIMLLFVMVLGYVSFEQTNNIHQQTEYLYNHPLQVRRAIGETKFNILAIHRGMKDLFLPGGDEIMPKTLIQNEQYKALAFEQIDVLYSRYLGPRSDVDSLKQNFIIWNSMRDETIRLLNEGKITEAASRTFNEGIAGSQVEILLKSIQKIDDFAKNKAETLYNSSVKHTRSLTWQLIIILFAIIILSFIVYYYIFRSIRTPLDDLTKAAKRFHGGDMDARALYQSNNELGLLSATYNAMAENIQLNTDIANKAASLSDKMLSEDDARKFFSTTLQLLMNQTGSQMAVAYLLSDDKKQFEHFESIGLSGSARQTFSATSPEGEFGAAIATGKVQHLSNIPETTRFEFHTVNGKFIPREIITIPIFAGNEAIAVLSLASVNNYGLTSIMLIEKIHATYAARIQGVLAYRSMKQLSEKLELQNRELEAQQKELAVQTIELKEQNRELEAQKTQLSEASRLKTNFLSNMSHELRTPLNSVIALSGVLSRRLVKQIPDEELSYLEVIERNGKHLLTLINDILDISRIESGKETIDVSEFEICAAINEVVTMIKPQADEKGLHLAAAIGDCQTRIVTDAFKFRHILQNLIVNAVKFTDKGQVDVAVKLINHKMAITVSDTGIGISGEHLPHIFDEFRQADSGVSRRFGGTGLGLAIAQKYAYLLGGSITVESVLGEGSTFTFIIPLLYNEKNKIAEKIAKPFSQLIIAEKQAITKKGDRSKTILIVEDSEPAIIQMRDIFEESGYEVVVARGGAEALELFGQISPDAIILDLMMPGIDGFNVLRTIRNAEIAAQIPVLILTAKHITKDELAFLKRNNIHQLIQKGDVKRDKLLQAVEEMVFGKKTETTVTERTKLTLTGTPTVLVVEDNPDNMITIKAVLADGYKVYEAADGLEAVEMAKKHVPDFILMDIALPKMDGIEAFKAIRGDGRLSHVPIIALTASALTEDREIILAYGFDAYIAKPIDQQQFFKTIKETLYGI
jgi:signal transduction histidine kinase/CheY-like chemotaxis protein/CHASE3 domain sensor protein